MLHERGAAARLASRSLALALLAVVVATPAMNAASPTTRRISVSSAGDEATSGRQWNPSLSANGRFAVFASEAPNLVGSDTNGEWDVFVRDRKTKSTSRVSVRSNGQQANGSSSFSEGGISADGRFVVFQSGADNLVPNDTNGQSDIFIRDRKKNKTKLVSVRSNGKQAKGGGSSSAVISANGRYVAFMSKATNLVKGDTNGEWDVFVHDRATRKTTRVSVRSNGKQAKGGASQSASISGDGRYVAFDSTATNLVRGDTNGMRDVFVHARATRKTTRVSVRFNGKQAKGGASQSPSISGDGRIVAFDSTATNLVRGDTNGVKDIFVRLRASKKTKRVNVASNGDQALPWASDQPSISANGRWVAFSSAATNLVSGDVNAEDDIFVRDRKKGKTRRVSIDSAGTESDGTSFHSTISGDGRFVAFGSVATNLVGDDTNGGEDVFRHGPLR